jgi:prepilin-type processing-associated H-X9-DG protein
LLPYIEETTLYQTAQLTSLCREEANGQRDGRTSWRSEDFEVNGTMHPSPWAAKLNKIKCPTESKTGNQTSGPLKSGNDPENPNPNGLGITNYRCNAGDLWVNWDADHVFRGPFGPQDCVEITWKDIKDGTSNTIGMSEACVGGHADVQGTLIRGNVAVNVGYGTPSRCKATAVSPTEFNAQFKGVETFEDRLFGGRWGGSSQAYTQFFTILPPKSPTCVIGQNVEGQLMTAASSYHSGGVNVAFCDGAVKFITDSIDYNGGTENPLGGTGDGNMGGVPIRPKSYYGLWGSLGSRSGQESVTPP